MNSDKTMTSSIARGRTDLVVPFLEGGGSAKAKEDGAGLIYWCARYGDVTAVRLLLKHGEELSSLGPDLGLGFAAFCGHWKLCRYLIECKVILAFGLLHYPRKLPVLDALGSRNVHYRIPRIGDYQGGDIAVVGGGDSAIDAAAMVLERNGVPHVVARSETLRVRMNDDGSVAIDPYYETSRRGIFAVGDVHGDVKLDELPLPVRRPGLRFDPVPAPSRAHRARRRRRVREGLLGCRW
jgi:hypothetical protein